MLTTLPQRVRDAWGEELAGELTRWLSENLQHRTVDRGEFREVLSRLDVLENEIAGINKRLDYMASRFDDMENRFNQHDERFDRIHDAMRTQTRWMVGTVSFFATLVTVLLAISLFAA